MPCCWRTLDVGQEALIYNLEGAARFEVGPKRLFLWREKFVPLLPYTANQNEYLVIQYNDGQVEHQAGPCRVFRNGLHHKSIRVEKAISLDANSVLVVYRRDSESEKVTRYIHHGPTLFTLAANEWLHEFSWHGVDPHNKTQMIPNTKVFTQLQVIPDQFYYNVDEVRTADDALIRVKLMMFYELRDIERMLDATLDPFADFINCLTADVMAFCAKLTYMEFMEKSADLNLLENYPQLMERCRVIGYEVSKVVFRGYYASPKLQEMHDHSITSRTKLKLAYEQEEQEQQLTDAKLRADFERISLEQKLELEQLYHSQEMKKKELEHKLALKTDEQKEEARILKEREDMFLRGKQASHEQNISHLKNLKDMGVDTTAYMVGLTPRPQKVIKVITQGQGANFHLHRN